MGVRVSLFTILVLLLCMSLAQALGQDTSISLPNYGTADYYVSTSGRSTNSGTSTSSPWDLQTAMSKARAGDTVFVRAGDYGNIRVTQSASGTASNYISFIGTDSNWNPIDSRKTGRSFNQGDTINANKMPLLRGSTSNNIKYSGTGVTLNGNYVRFENFQITRYDKGLEVKGSNSIIKNTFIVLNGDFRPGLEGGFDNYAGRSITLSGDNVKVLDSMFQDAGAQGLTIYAKNGRYDNILSYATNNNNDMDYDFLFSAGAMNNLATNIIVYREAFSDHTGHGIVMKSGTGDTQNNVVDGFEIYNTHLELQFGGTSNNIVRNGLIIGTNWQQTTQKWDWKGAIRIANGAHQNLIEDVTVKNVLSPIVFSDWDDGAAGKDEVSAGYDNTLRRITTDNTAYVVFFRRNGVSDFTPGVALNNKIYDSTFRNSDYLIRTLKTPNSGTEFHNIVVENIKTFKVESEGSVVNTNTVFDCIKLTNSFSASQLTPYIESNINGNCDGSAGSSSTTSTPQPTQPTTPTTTSPVTLTNVQATTETNSFVVEWDLSVGATGQIQYGTSQNLGQFSNKENRYLDYHRQTISGLNDDTYYYRVIGEDANGNSYASSISQVTISSGQTTQPTTSQEIVVSNMEILELGEDGFVVGYTTNVPTTGQVLYGTSGGLGKGTSVQTARSTEHQIQVSSLEAGTVYFYRVTGTDANGNTYSSQISLTRTYGASTSQPTQTTNQIQITNLQATAVDGGFDVEWNANVGVTGQTFYGTTQNLGQTSNQELRYLDYHNQKIRDVGSGTYYYQIRGEDENGNTYASSIESITLGSSTTTNTNTNTNTGSTTTYTNTVDKTINIPSYGAPKYYVTPDGKSTNSGTSKTSPWDLQTAMSKARAGDTVFVRAGTYSNIRVTQSADGTASNYISFIGTDSNWNPIDSRKTGRSFNRGSSIDANKMPLLKGTMVNSVGQGIGITLNGDYVRLENFQLTQYTTGIQSSGNNQLVKNIFAYYMGDFRSGADVGLDVVSARGINVYGDRMTLVDSMFQDIGTIAVNVQSASGRYDNILVYATPTNNPTGYYFLLTNDAINNLATNIEVYRTPGLAHGGHGICLKSGTGKTEGNIIDRFKIYNTNLEIQFPGVGNNIARNGYITTTNSVAGSSKYGWSGGITISNGAHNNLVEDVIVEKTKAGITFHDWNDGRAGDVAKSGVENTFRRVTVDGGMQGILYVVNPNDASYGEATNNLIEDSTFKNLDYMFTVSNRPNSGTVLKNILISNVPRFIVETGATLNKNTIFNCVKLTNSFSASSLTPYVESNINGACTGSGN